MNVRVLSLLTIMLLLPLCAFSQTKVVFDYDESGNRIVRKPYSSKASAPKQSPSEPKGQRHGIAHYGELVVNASQTEVEGVYEVSLSAMPDGQYVKINVYDAAGVLIISTELPSYNGLVDLSSRPNGVYVIEAVIGKKSKTIKVTK